jgi:aconitate hydratase
MLWTPPLLPKREKSVNTVLSIRIFEGSPPIRHLWKPIHPLPSLSPKSMPLARQTGTHFIVAGRNYGQGSSREHAALGPRFLGLRAVLAKHFARIHALVNFGVLPLAFVDPEDYDKVQSFDELRLSNLGQVLATGNELLLDNLTQKLKIKVRHRMSPRQVQLVLKGGLINWTRQRLPENPSGRTPRPQAGRE